MKLKVEDLIKEVRQIPPSSESVIDIFTQKCAEKMLNGILTGEQVIEIVDNWPNGCPEGRAAYLKRVGIARPKNKVFITGYIKKVNAVNRFGFKLEDACLAPSFAPYELIPVVQRVKSNTDGATDGNPTGIGTVEFTYGDLGLVPTIGQPFPDRIHEEFRYVITKIELPE